MTDFGEVLQPLNPGAWPGVDRESVGDRGELILRRIIGGYVRGKEIRTWPGFKCAVNPVVDSESVHHGVYSPGYRQAVIDARRPVARRPSSTTKYPLRVGHEQEMRVYADPVHLHSLHWIRGRGCLIGESSLRIEPIVSQAAPTVPLEITIISLDAITLTKVELQLSGTFPVSTGAFNTAQVGDAVWIADVVGTTAPQQAMAAALNNRAHKIISLNGGAGTIVIDTAYTVGIDLSLNPGRIGRCMGNRSGLMLGGKRVYGEGIAGEALQDVDSLTAWWVDDDVDVEGDPIRSVFAAYVANRQRDFGDQSNAVAPAANVQSRLVEGYQPHAFNSFTPKPNWGITRRPPKELPFRTVPAMGGSRIVLAAPGYACMFQVPCRIPVSADTSPGYQLDGAWGYHNSIYDRPQCLGVPKAQILEAEFEVGVTAEPVPPPLLYKQPHFQLRGNANGYRDGTWRVAVAYRNDATGDIGDLSEVWEFTLDAPLIGAGPALDSYDVLLAIKHPGYVLAECLAMSVMLFMSEKNGTSLGHVMTFQLGDLYTAYAGAVVIPGTSQSSLYGLEPYGASGASVPTVPNAVELFDSFMLAPIEPLTDVTLINGDVLVPDFANMPRGAKFVSVTRGVMVSGGALGTIGREQELMTGSIRLFQITTLGATNTEDEPDILTIPRCDGQNQSIQVGPWPTGNGMLPSSYGGTPILSQSVFPYPLDRQTLSRALNPRVAKNTDATVRENVAFMDRWKLDEKAVRLNGGRQASPTGAHAQQFRSQLQTSELGEFGLTLATGDVIVDTKKDDDVEAAREFMGVLVVCSKSQTFTMSWQAGAGGAVPFTASNEHGCIAAASMIEATSMLAWISASGPVAYSGSGVVDIGRALTRDFVGHSARFLRDSRGLMRHSWGAYDKARGLVLFGVFENRAAGSADEVTVIWKGVTYNWDAAPDEAKSRFPCDTVLAYSEASGAWSEWHPPAGLEVFWMTPWTCSDGSVRMAALTNDRRVYVFDDEFGEQNRETPIVTITANATATTTVSHDGAIGNTASYLDGDGAFLRDDGEVLVFDQADKLRYRMPASPVQSDDSKIEFSSAVTVEAGWRILLQPKSIVIETNFINRKGGKPMKMGPPIIRGQPRSRITQGAAGAVRQPVFALASAQKQTHPAGIDGGGVDKHKDGVPLTRNELGERIAYSGPTEQNRIAELVGGAVAGLELALRLEVFGGAQFCIQDIVPRLA